MKNIIIITLLIFLPSCARQVKPVDVANIDNAVNTSILQPSETDTPVIKSEKALVRNTLTEAKGTIIEKEKETKKLQNKIKAEQKFSRIGKTVVAVVAGIILFFLIVFIVKIYLRVQTGGLIK